LGLAFNLVKFFWKVNSFIGTRYLYYFNFGKPHKLFLNTIIKGKITKREIKKITPQLTTSFPYNNLDNKKKPSTKKTRGKITMANFKKLHPRTKSAIKQA